MPVILRPEQGNSGGPRMDAEYLRKDFGYEYPDGLDLRPSSKLHQTIVERLRNLADQSWSIMQERHSSWNDIDKTLKAYIRTDDAEKIVQGADDRKPVSIVIPYSYAQLETLLTYMTEALLASGPILQYSGRGPEDEIGALLLEKVVEYQMQYTKAMLPLHSMFRDSLAYGLGGVAVSWTSHYGIKNVAEERPIMGRVMDKVLRRDTVVEEQEVLEYEGNELLLLDPYCMLPDPNVSVHEVQKGEYFGWIGHSNVYNLLSAEKHDPDLWFNGKYIKARGAPFESRYSRDASARQGTSRTSTAVWSFPTTELHMYVTIIPRDWNDGDGHALGDSEYPEKWLFTIVDDEVLVRAQPIDLQHNRYPVALCAPDYDGYSIAPPGRLELLYGLQHSLDWEFNSRRANKRKVLNDMFVVDPNLINMDDMTKPGPGKLIRLKRAAWGHGVKDAVMQLGVQDVTQSNVKDAAIIMELMQKVSAATDATMGISRQSSERVTATEFQQTVGSALSRLKHLALVISEMAMKDIGHLCASHTNQLMSEDMWMKVTGEWPEVLRQAYGKGEGVNISPKDLMVAYDVIVKDGTSPQDLGMSSQTWFQIFQMVGGNPRLSQTFDITKIFSRLTHTLGASNMQDYILQNGQGAAELAADEQVAEQANSGELTAVEDIPQM